MAKKPKSLTADWKQMIVSYRHDAKRVNNPDVGMVNPETDPDQPKTSWAYDPHIDPALQFDVQRAHIERIIDDALEAGDENIMREALEALKRMQSPYLNWTGKAERTSFEVDTVSLHVHERIDPASILSALQKKVKGASGGSHTNGVQGELFNAPFENLPLRDAVSFYKHDKGWSNRLIAGDSLLVMNSLLQKESLAGQVQMIYIDPPYGIKYGSNFQPFVNKRDVKDGKDGDLTQEPEMIKAFRDTWELGIHSYLSYLRDRLLLARELLNETGSVFVQISDENVHHVRELMDEVFGASNFIAQIVYRTTGGLGSEYLNGTYDLILWYARNKETLKYRSILVDKDSTPVASSFKSVTESNTTIQSFGGTNFITVSLVSSGYTPSCMYTFEYQGMQNVTRNGSWKTNQVGMDRLSKSNRLIETSNTVRYLYFKEDYPVSEFTNAWFDTGGAQDKQYVVQTSQRVIERCILLSSDPGDLVLDITCGSGTTAVVAEKWGRRWITCDTSRVAIALAKQRLMTASFDYYEMRYPNEGLKGGFIYDTVPHVTLKSIANNPEIDEIYERMHPAMESALSDMNSALQKHADGLSIVITEGVRKKQKIKLGGKETLFEWEVPFEIPIDWPAQVHAPFKAFHDARLAMQKQMDASIAAHADQEVLYDKPKINKNKLRITGPFTVEAVPFSTVVSLDEGQRHIEPDASIARSGETSRQSSWRDELLKTGVRGKGGQKFEFASLETVPELRYIHAQGVLKESGEKVVVSFGPEHAALEQRQVELAMREAEKLRPAPKIILFCAFTIDPEAAKDIDATQWEGVTLLRVQMNTDLLTEDLKKASKSNQSFWLMGQPDIDVSKRADGLYEVSVHGFDYFDTVRGELISGGTKNIAMWMLDTDYDERSLYSRQVFFPMAGEKDGWHRLRKTIRAELDESKLEAFHGTVSLPFEVGENRKIAVKIVDDRGIESLKIVEVE